MARNINGKGFSLKDALFNEEKVTYLAEQLAKADPQFEAESFVKRVMSKLTTLELKERIVWIATVLEEQLPTDFTEAAAVIQRSLPPPLDPTRSDNDFGDFIFAPLGAYVVRNGLTQRHLYCSLQTLEAITQRFSMEDAIRYFINAFEEETLAALELWTSHRHYHVRRLVSEGTRPLLPWSGRIKLDIKKALPFLDQLYSDPTRYVTRSVANHMNDIAKQEPSLVVATLKRWQEEGRQDPKEMDWIMRHSLRTLVKEGNTEALALLGYDPSPKIKVTNTAVNRGMVRVGEVLEFSFTLAASQSGALMIDYVIDFQKANHRTNQRVFKLKKMFIQKGETVTLTKRHHFPGAATTLKFYPGKHTLTIQINGKQCSSVDFQLT